MFRGSGIIGILFLYRDALMLELPWMDNFERSKKPKRLPMVLTTLEIQMFLREVAVAPGPIGLIIKLLYGSGMRLMEVVRLRGKDVELTHQEIVVRDGKDRVTMLPGSDASSPSTAAGVV